MFVSPVITIHELGGTATLLPCSLTYVELGGNALDDSLATGFRIPDGGVEHRPGSLGVGSFSGLRTRKLRDIFAELGTRKLRSVLAGHNDPAISAPRGLLVRWGVGSGGNDC